LFAVAGERMLRAQGEGGNRVVCSQAAMALGGSPIVVDRSPAQAVAGNETVRHSKLARLGLSLLPLLHRLDKEFSLGLPLVDMERRLTRAQDESADFNQNTTRGV